MPLYSRIDTSPSRVSKLKMQVLSYRTPGVMLSACPLNDPGVALIGAAHRSMLISKICLLRSMAMPESLLVERISGDVAPAGGVIAEHRETLVSITIRHIDTVGTVHVSST